MKKIISSALIIICILSQFNDCMAADMPCPGPGCPESKKNADDAPCPGPGCPEHAPVEPYGAAYKNDNFLESAKVSGGISASAWLVSVLSSVGASAGGAGPPSLAPTPVMATVASISPKSVKSGNLLSYSLSAFSGDIGFNFAPSRILNQSVFWNSAIIAQSNYDQVGAYTSFDRYQRYSAAFKIGERFGLGAGYLYLSRNDDRRAVLDNGKTVAGTFKTNENGLFLAASYVASEKMSIGLTGKRINQQIETPGSMVVVDALDTANVLSWESSRVEKTVYDYDLTSSYKLTTNTSIGFSIINVLGEKLLSDNDTGTRQRMACFGYVYEWSRLQVGIDALYREAAGVKMALGINLVPFKNVLIYSGYDTTYSTYSHTIKYYWLSYTYNHNKVFGTSHFAGVNVSF